MDLTMDGEEYTLITFLMQRKLKASKLLYRILNGWDFYGPYNSSYCSNCTDDVIDNASMAAKVEAMRNNHSTDLARLLLKVCQKMMDKGVQNVSELAGCQDLLKEGGEEDRLPADIVADLSLPCKTSLVVLYSLIMTVSLVGNLLVVLSLIFNRHLRSIVNVFIVSLALSDLLVTLTSMPFNLGTALTKHWVFGDFACKIMPFMSNLTVASSALTLCCIAIDRYYAIVHPLKLRSVRTPKRAALLLVVVWLLSIASSVPYARYFTLTAVCTQPGSCRDPASSDHVAYLCVEPMDNRIVSIQAWLTLVVLLVFPVLFLGGVYGRIVVALWVKRPVGTGSTSQTQYKRKAIKMLVLVVLVFVVSWTPLLVFNVLVTSASEANVTLRYFLQWLALSSACYNPVVYAFMNDRFRRTYATLLACKPRVTRAVFPASSPCPAPRVDHVGKEAPGAPPTFSAVPGTNRLSVEHLQPRGSYGIFTTSVGGATSVNRVRGVAPAGGAKGDVIKVGGRSGGVANISMVTRHGTEVSREAEGVAEVDSATGSTGRREATSAGNSARNATSHCAGAAKCLDVTHENSREEDGRHANEVWETEVEAQLISRRRVSLSTPGHAYLDGGSRVVVMTSNRSLPRLARSPTVLEAREATLCKSPADWTL